VKLLAAIASCRLGPWPWLSKAADLSQSQGHSPQANDQDRATPATHGQHATPDQQCHGHPSIAKATVQALVWRWKPNVQLVAFGTKARGSAAAALNQASCCFIPRLSRPSSWSPPTGSRIRDQLALCQVPLLGWPGKAGRGVWCFSSPLNANSIELSFKKDASSTALALIWGSVGIFDGVSRERQDGMRR